MKRCVSWRGRKEERCVKTSEMRMRRFRNCGRMKIKRRSICVGLWLRLLGWGNTATANHGAAMRLKAGDKVKKHFITSLFGWRGVKLMFSIGCLHKLLSWKNTVTKPATTFDLLVLGILLNVQHQLILSILLFYRTEKMCK